MSTLRLHLEVNADGSGRSEPVPVHGVLVNIDKEPFLAENHIKSAKVVDVFGGFVIEIQFDRDGTLLLEQYSSRTQGRRVAVFSQFGEKGELGRWLAAPVLTKRIPNGLFTFTPDATRDEADQIVLGLNNTGKQNEKDTKW